MKAMKLRILGTAVLLACASMAHAANPATVDDNTRYLAMGDSLTAGYGAMPATDGYAYLLYREGAYDTLSNTLFANIALPGATSAQVLAYQVPLATSGDFPPDVVTMTVGGNDVLAILQGADPQQAVYEFQGNFASILYQLCAALPDTRIYVGNLYSIQNFPVPTDPVIQAFNQVVGGVAAFMNGAGPCGGRVKVADVYSAFSGSQEGLLLVNRHGASPFQPHPTNAGYRAMEKAFLDAR